MNPFDEALAKFDAANAADPHGRELDHAMRLYAWVKKLAPNASEALLLASRCQHIKRWSIPRDRFPEGKAGYHQWRTTLAKFHAEEAGKILAQVGYPEATIRRVQELNQKKGLGTDPEVQTLEDALCLVFLETQFHEFKNTKDEAKMIDIVRKTWAKMSPQAREIAGTLNLDASDSQLLKKALTQG
jgi:hypothetical protein